VGADVQPLSTGALARLAEVVSRPEVPGGRYEVLEQVGAGGMGVVYRALDRTLQREVAIKVVHDTHGATALAEHLRGEAQTLAALEHPSIPPVHEVGDLADGRAYYVMRFVHGVTLARAPADALNAGLRLFLRLCEAVAQAHAKGVVHRDLKPENIMLGAHGELYIMDWGIARALESGSASAAKSPAGTPGYMAPEQAHPDSHPIDARADVYALGGILAFLSTRRGPDRAGMLDLTGVRAPLAAVIARARQSEPRARYASAPELARDVAAYLDREPVAAYREGALERAGRFLLKHQFVAWLVVGYLTVRVLVLVLYRR
jgi:eukaryotic-like serine/threonine-protein kinase